MTILFKILGHIGGIIAVVRDIEAAAQQPSVATIMKILEDAVGLGSLAGLSDEQLSTVQQAVNDAVQALGVK